MTNTLLIIFLHLNADFLMFDSTQKMRGYVVLVCNTCCMVLISNRSGDLGFVLFCFVQSENLNDLYTR